MDGSSKKDIQEDHHAVNRDADPSHAIEYHQEGQRSTPFIGYQHRGRKEIAARGKRPLDINNNLSVFTDGDENVEKNTAVEQPPKLKRQKTGSNEDKRNRASPARLFKLNKLLVPVQQGQAQVTFSQFLTPALYRSWGKRKGGVCSSVTQGIGMKEAHNHGEK